MAGFGGWPANKNKTGLATTLILVLKLNGIDFHHIPTSLGLLLRLLSENMPISGLLIFSARLWEVLSVEQVKICLKSTIHFVMTQKRNTPNTLICKTVNILHKKSPFS